MATPTKLTNLTVTGDATIGGSLSVTGATVQNDEITRTTTVNTNKKLQFRDTGIYVNSGADGKLTISADGSGADDITLDGAVTCTDDMVFATGKQIKPNGATATSTAAAATIDEQCGVITTEALTTAAGSAYTMTLTCSLIAATSIVFPVFWNGTNSQGTLALGKVTPGTGSATIIINNIHASQALNGTIKIGFFVVNPS